MPILFIPAAAVLLMLAWLWHRLAQKRCPRCASRKIVQIEQSAEDLMAVDVMGGEGSGKVLMMRVVTVYFCHHCAYRWRLSHREV